MTKFVEIRGGGEFTEERLLSIAYMKGDKLFARGPEVAALQFLLRDGIRLKSGQCKEPQKVFENLRLHFKSAYLYATIIKEDIKLPLSEYSETEIQIKE